MSQSPPSRKHKLPQADSLDGSIANGADVSVASKKRKSVAANTTVDDSTNGDVKPDSEDPAFRYVCPIATPFANKKLSKKLAKLIPKGF